MALTFETIFGRGPSGRRGWPPDRRHLVAGGVGLVGHVVVLGLILTGRGAVMRDYAQGEAPPPPFFIQLEPARPTAADAASPTRTTDRPSPPQPRAARPVAAAPLAVQPLVTPTAPGPRAPPRQGDDGVTATLDQTTPRTPTTIRGAPRPGEAVTPQSWRVACSLPPAPAAVSDAVLDACRESLVARVQPRGGNRVARPPTDRRPEFERETARARARQEYLRAPGPVGGSNAGPSDAPGSNFGMGSVTDSVIPLTSTTSGGTTVLPRRTPPPPPAKRD